MERQKKSLLREAFVVLLVFACAGFIILPFSGGYETVDMQVHDTYFVLPFHYMQALLFLYLTVVVYLIRQTTNRFIDVFQNGILAIASALLVAAATILISMSVRLAAEPRA